MPPRPPRRSPARLLAPLPLLAALAGGCGEGFPPENRIEQLRVMAIRSEPVAPAPGETTTLSALVYTPTPADPTLSYAWSWCPLAGSPNDGYPCAIDEGQLAGMAGQAGVSFPPYDLGTGATAQLPHTVPPALLQQLCAAAGMTMVGGQLLELNCDGGFPVQVKLTVKTATDEVKAVRRLRLRLAAGAAGGEPNTNPRIDNLFLVTRDEAGNETSAMPITDAADLTIFRAKEALLRAVVPADSAEPYTGKDIDQKPKATTESLSLTWMVETGDTKEETTNYVEGLNTLEQAMKNEWEPERAKDYAPTTAKIFLILRDNRDGVAWRSGTVMLGEAP